MDCISEDICELADPRLVNIQSVIADTQRDIDNLQRQIGSLISADSDRVAVRREIGERSLRIRWVRDRVAEVERTIDEGGLQFDSANSSASQDYLASESSGRAESITGCCNRAFRADRGCGC